jgi:hypothetical protein
VSILTSGITVEVHDYYGLAVCYLRILLRCSDISPTHFSSSSVGIEFILVLKEMMITSTQSREQSSFIVLFAYHNYRT